MPLCPVNQMRPLPSKAAVLRLAYDVLRPCPDRFARGIDAHDGVLAAVGEPRRPVRPDNDAVRCGIRAERDALDRTARRVQLPGNAVILSGVPDLAAWPDSHIVRIVTAGQVVIPGFLGVGRYQGRRRDSKHDEQATHKRLHFGNAGNYSRNKRSIL